MSRPVKLRRVCCLPTNRFFGPLNSSIGDNNIIMTVDEYETIRLIDYEGATQEECAAAMNVARTTVQRIYNEARTKIATSIIESKPLFIKGGMYKLYNDNERGKNCSRCGTNRCCSTLRNDNI